ncbi:integral membrane protein, YkoY family [Marinococcus luteus]|uniref:Integral membrane protein, YkoY family n=1 Tax=Marinococcus luteus TaxID=1122204 RepID=A0A1H2RTG9_9BACI|nr:TerC family protein [Marinococcus luteus]SDW21929.1 integral membrane protein, YkoY family [Marinococcus luteus]
MDVGLLMEYSWVLVILVLLEGVLAADNAMVLAVMVKDLPEKQRKKALFYGLFGAFLFRFGSLFIISFLAGVWQVQAIGAAYLLYIAINHIIRHMVRHHQQQNVIAAAPETKSPGFWKTVFKVELADIAFAVDSILAGVALAITLPASGLPAIGGLDGGIFAVILFGGLIGVVIMRFAAGKFVTLLEKRPGLEITAFVIVGWVGVKLAVYALSHPSLHIIPEAFSHSPLWKASFYIVLVMIAVSGWFLSSPKSVDETAKEH